MPLVPSPHGMRLAPTGAPGDFRTFGVRSPIETHTRPASCAEVECAHHVNGWRTAALKGSDQEALIRQAMRGEVDGHKRFALELPAGEHGIEFLFEPGQPCFAASAHRVDLERPALFLRRDGDWRAHLGGERVYDRPDQFAEDLHTHTTSIRHLKDTRG